MKPTLEQRKKAITDEIIALQKRADVLVKQRQVIDREISAIQTRGNQLDGQMQFINETESYDKAEKQEEKPSKKNDKK